MTTPQQNDETLKVSLTTDTVRCRVADARAALDQVRLHADGSTSQYETWLATAVLNVVGAVEVLNEVVARDIEPPQHPERVVYDDVPDPIPSERCVPAATSSELIREAQNFLDGVVSQPFDRCIANVPGMTDVYVIAETLMKIVGRLITVVGDHDKALTPPPPLNARETAEHEARRGCWCGPSVEQVQPR